MKALSGDVSPRADLKSLISLSTALVSRISIGPFRIGKRKCCEPSLPNASCATPRASARSAAMKSVALEARHPLQHVVREADLAEFAVADHIDADLLLTRNHFGNSRADARVERYLINRLVIEQVVKHSSNIIGPRQAASVSRQNMFGAQLHNSLPI